MAKKQIGEIDFNVEFNDSVLSTKTWNNPRYDGSKTQTQILNKFTVGDITYGKKTAVQKYSRNIYVGKKIIGYLDDLYLDAAHTIPNTGSNGGRYLGFEDWSFVVLEKFYTVNDDDSLEQAKKFETPENESADPLSREFKSDFIAGTRCNIIDYSDTTSNLETNYRVQFNKGLLGKIAEGVGTVTDYGLTVTTPNSSKIQNRFTFNQAVTNYDNPAFYVQPLSTFNQFWVNISGSGYGPSTGGAVTSSQFFEALGERQREYNEKYVIKFFSTSSDESAYVSNEFGLSSILAYQINDIRRIPGSNQISATIANTDTNPLQTANNVPVTGATSFIDFSLDNNTNFTLYYLNESNNVIIVDLPRKRDLPEGINKFIVLPENVHPYIKDNIDYFVNQIGLVDSNESFTINPQNRQLS